MIGQIIGAVAALMGSVGHTSWTEAKVDLSRLPVLSPVGREPRMEGRIPERRSYLASRREARRRRNIRMHRRAR